MSVRQTTAIDIWSAGVTMLTLMSRRYPVFPVRRQAERAGGGGESSGTESLGGIRVGCEQSGEGCERLRLGRMVEPLTDSTLNPFYYLPQPPPSRVTQERNTAATTVETKETSSRSRRSRHCSARGASKSQPEPATRS